MTKEAANSEVELVGMEVSPETGVAVQQTTHINSIYPLEGEWKLMMSMASTLVKSGMLPQSINTPQQALAVMLKGRELGIPAMQSFSHIYVVSGKPACSSELMLALLARGGITWTWKKDGTDRKCAEIIFHRKGFKDYLSRFTLEDAEKIVKHEDGKQKKATDTYTWKSYMPNMLRARAISNGARIIGPDLIGGMSYTVEELVQNDSVAAVEAEVRGVTEDIDNKTEERKRKAVFGRVLKAIDSVHNLRDTVQWADTVARLFELLAIPYPPRNVIESEDVTFAYSDCEARYLDVMEGMTSGELETFLSSLRVEYRDLKAIIKAEKVEEEKTAVKEGDIDFS